MFATFSKTKNLGHTCKQILLLGSCLQLHRCNTFFFIAELLASTLFTFQVHACEKDRLQIRCPQGTTIDVKSAHYGRQVPPNEMCPPLPVVGRYKMANEEEEKTTEADDDEEDTKLCGAKFTEGKGAIRSLNVITRKFNGIFWCFCLRFLLRCPLQLSVIVREKNRWYFIQTNLVGLSGTRNVVVT